MRNRTGSRKAGRLAKRFETKTGDTAAGWFLPLFNEMNEHNKLQFTPTWGEIATVAVFVAAFIVWAFIAGGN